MIPRATARSRAPRGQGERLRDEILDAAEDLLARTASEEAVSIRAVSDAVGVTAPSIYRHFDDKNHLIYEVCLRCFGELAEVIAAAVVPDGPVATLRAQARAYIHFGMDHPEHYRVMFMGRFELTPEQYADELLTDTSAFGMLHGTVDAILATGRVRPELAAEGPMALALLCWSTVHGLTSLLVAKPRLPWPDIDHFIEAMLDTHVRGMLRGRH
ncbi:TetR/AcrR family transcriptional regulator [soil metagenome]